jgi:predicted protein tyrosine phosphatase
MQNKISLTEAIFSTGCPYNNMYQGHDKRVLFVCSAGILRSATGARLYSKKYNTRACGTHNYALIPLSANLILWADEIVFVNMENHAEACTKFNMDEYDGRVKILSIPDDYCHMQPELIQYFIKQYEPLE